MNGTIPRPLVLLLWILAIMAVVNLLTAWQSQSGNWWLSICFALSAGVCLTIAATSRRSATR
jgi:hypothetical protein